MVPWPPLPTDLTDLDPNGPAFKTFTGPALDMNIEHSRTERWRRADIGAVNGHGNARSIARIQSAVACGGEVAGVRLLSPKTIDRIFEVQSEGVDLSKLETGEDLGASLAVDIDGEMVVDLWGGWADEARAVPWAEDTIACVFSTTKIACPGRRCCPSSRQAGCVSGAARAVHWCSPTPIAA